MTVPIGKMRDLVEILRPTVTTDTAGGEVRTYVSDGSAYCWIKPLRGRELVQARQVVSDVTHRIIGHYSALKTVQAEYRIREKGTGREFDVQVPLPGDARDQVELMAVYRANG